MSKYDVNQWWKNCGLEAKSNFPNTRDKAVSPVVVAKVIQENNENDKLILNEFKKNEEHKRKLKLPIFITLTIFSFIQVLVMNAIVLVVIISSTAGEEPIWFIHKMEIESLPELYGFLKFYISATIAELLGTITIMVTKVFDNPIKDFFKINQQHKLLKDKNKQFV